MSILTVGLRIALLWALCSCAGVTFDADSSASDGLPGPEAFVELAAQENVIAANSAQSTPRDSRVAHAAADRTTMPATVVSASPNYIRLVDEAADQADFDRKAFAGHSRTLQQLRV
jgi:hypothetical protein